MAELDELLSTTLKRIAPPADSSGVAEAIRARVEAGDAGISAASSTAPGWGGGGAAGWLPWIGVVVVVGLVGGGVGVSGLAGAATDETVVVGHTSVLDAVVDAGSCPGGPVVRTLSADTRVLAVARSEDSAYLGVRNPDDVAATIWVPASMVVPDDAADLAALPIGEACPTGTLAPLIVVPVEPTPEPNKPTPGSKDTTVPTINAGKWSPTPIYSAGQAPLCVDESLIVVTAADNVGVVGVTPSTSQPGASVTLVSSGGGSYTFKFEAPLTGNVPDATPNVTFTATDAVGNSSSVARSLTLKSSFFCFG